MNSTLKLAINLFSARAVAMKEKNGSICMHVNMYRLECRGERQEQASVAERSSVASKDGSLERSARWPYTLAG